MHFLYKDVLFHVICIFICQRLPPSLCVFMPRFCQLFLKCVGFLIMKFPLRVIGLNYLYYIFIIGMFQIVLYNLGVKVSDHCDFLGFDFMNLLSNLIMYMGFVILIEFHCQYIVQARTREFMSNSGNHPFILDGDRLRREIYEVGYSDLICKLSTHATPRVRYYGYYALTPCCIGIERKCILCILKCMIMIIFCSIIRNFASDILILFLSKKLFYNYNMSKYFALWMTN